MDSYLKALLQEIDETLEILIEVMFKDQLLPMKCTLSQAFDDNYVRDVLSMIPLTSTEKINKLSDTFRFLENRDAVKYIQLPLKQRDRINMVAIGDNYKLLAASIKSYYNDNNNIIPLSVSMLKIADMKNDRKKVKELQNAAR